MSAELAAESLDEDRANGPRAPVRTVQVLQYLAAHPGGTSLATASQELQLPKTSLFRILRSLESGGYVSSANGLHQVGPEALKLGISLMRNRDTPYSARPTMEWLSRESRETVILGEIDEAKANVIYKDVIGASGALRFSVDVGTANPLYTSASGLAILAYMPRSDLDKYLRAVRFEARTPATISNAATLRERLAQIRANGVSVSDGGMFEGVFSVAAPLVNANGHVRAGVSISAPSVRGIKQREYFAELVLKAGAEISRLLGYRSGYPPGWTAEPSIIERGDT